MLYLPTFPPGDSLQSLQAMHTVPTHHPTRATLMCCLVAKPEHTSSSKKAQKIFVVHIGKFRSIYWTNPLFVGIKAIQGLVLRSDVLQPSVLAALLVVNPDPDTTGVVRAGKRKAGQGRSGRPMFLSGRDGIFYSLSVSRLDDTERRSVTPPPPSPSEDHDASLLLPSLRSCSRVSCVGMPLAPAHTSLGLNSLWLVLLSLAGNQLQWGYNINACTLHAIFTHTFAYQIIPLFLLLSHLNVAYRRVGQVNNERKQGAREQDTEVESSGEASDRVTDRQTPNQDMDRRFVYDVRQLPDGVAEEEFD
ncbi:hypothetical protein EDB87DRAFT_1581373 [Lactarius vividus]|nr:hypothetical protein EDB87DRAFT_1581373 [Lactarius vividus]